MHDRYRDIGLLWIRIGIGAMFVIHGWPKLIGGPTQWAKLGAAMKHLGIDFLPSMWGFMAAVAEFGGGILLALGLVFRPACLLLFTTMFVAAAMHLDKGDGLAGSSHAIEAAILFFGLFLTGPGSLALEMRVRSGRS